VVLVAGRENKNDAAYAAGVREINRKKTPIKCQGKSDEKTSLGNMQDLPMEPAK